jgi:hypothetical protein
MASRYESSASDSWPCADCPDDAFLVVIASARVLRCENRAGVVRVPDTTTPGQRPGVVVTSQGQAGRARLAQCHDLAARFAGQAGGGPFQRLEAVVARRRVRAVPRHLVVGHRDTEPLHLRHVQLTP